MSHGIYLCYTGFEKSVDDVKYRKLVDVLKNKNVVDVLKNKNVVSRDIRVILCILKSSS